MAIPDRIRALERDLHGVFGDRLHSLVMYRPTPDAPGAPVPTLATVGTITADDLRACASLVDGWRDAGIATPLLLTAHEFARALDAFPLEFGAIIADHVLVAGRDPFQNLTVDSADLRRACEIQARSHLLHLREGYVETRGRGDAVSGLLVDSAAPLEGLLTSVARLIGTSTHSGEDAAGVVERAADLPAGCLSKIVAVTGSSLSADEARRLFPGYLDAVERLTLFVDRWSPR